MLLKTSSVRRDFDLKIKALKEQEELPTRWEKLRREAEQKEIADLQVLARKARKAEKEIERASSRGSSLRSISPVGTPDDNLTKVSGWMDKTEEAENEAPSINVPPGYQRTTVSAPIITVRSNGGQSSAQVRDLTSSLKPVISTKAAVRDIGKDRTKIGAGSQRVITQPEVKFASSKPSMTRSADQNRLPPTFRGIPSGAFQVPQLPNIYRSSVCLVKGQT